MKKQIPLFLVIGGLGFCIDAGGVYLMVTLLGNDPLMGRVPGFALAIVTTFLLNRFFTFQSENPAPIIKAFAKYIAANAFSQGTNFGVYGVLVAQVLIFKAYPIAAVFIGSGIAAILSFILYKTVVFKSHA